MNSAPTDLVIARLAAVERPADLRAAKGYDQFFGFAAISLMLFVPQLKSLTPLLLLVLLVFHCVWRREDIPACCAHRASICCCRCSRRPPGSGRSIRRRAAITASSS
ncbi:hypothetical protein ACFSTI_29740 [Rhizorhabdus histidinilytica]